MSLPPETIQVKRKRSGDGEDGSVDYLLFERDNKRSRSIHADEHWVYQRKTQETDSIPDIPPLPRQDVKPVIQVSQPGDENRTVRPPRGNTSDPQPAVPSPLPTILASRATDSSADNVRRFHLSRAPAPQPSSVVQPRGISKKRGASTLFVERARRKRASDVASLLSKAKREATGGLGAGKAHEEIKMEDVSLGGDVPSNQASRPNKRPGASSRTAPASKPTLPPSLLDRHGVDMDQLAKDMDSYTLSHIHHALELEKERAEKHAQASARAAQRAKFRPKAPAQRFAERNPDFVAQVAQGQVPKPIHDGMEVDEGASDDEDYVLETYVRVPASQLTETVQPHQVGLLVFDNEPDMEFFYGNDEDSEEELFLDEDDENAENYYGADYPDEDLPWDDEFDMNPYHYRTGNASDLEDFDERDFDKDNNAVNSIWDDNAPRTTEDEIFQRLGDYAFKHGK